MEFAHGFAISAASAAALADVWSRRIPNWLTMGACAAGVVVGAWTHGLEGGLAAMAGLCLGLGILLPFHIMGVMGAGDVKLLAAMGALLGPSLLFSVAVYAGLAGGVLSLVILARRGALWDGFRELVIQHRVPKSSGATAPYGVAIASGVYLAFILPAVIR